LFNTMRAMPAIGSQRSAASLSTTSRVRLFIAPFGRPWPDVRVMGMRILSVFYAPQNFPERRRPQRPMPVGRTQWSLSAPARGPVGPVPVSANARKSPAILEPRLASPRPAGVFEGCFSPTRRHRISWLGIVGDRNGARNMALGFRLGRLPRGRRLCMLLSSFVFELVA
jgi:hypothetical protein